MQYFTKLPSGLVELHLVGATIIAGATAWLCLRYASGVLTKSGASTPQTSAPPPRCAQADSGHRPRKSGTGGRQIPVRKAFRSAVTSRCHSRLSARQPSSVRPRFQ